jgi:glycosyltransferase involved in cell wall biosynthesis
MKQFMKMFAGQVDDVFSVWDRHNLGVLASRFEGLSVPVMEAMMLGRANVVTRGCRPRLKPPGFSTKPQSRGTPLYLSLTDELHRRLCSLPKGVMGRSWRIR